MLLYYVHMTMNNQINCKWLHVLIMHICRLVKFHIQRCFCAILSLRVSDSGQPKMYVRQYCTNNPGHKLYRCMASGYTRHYLLLYNPLILRTKIFFVPACHLYKIYRCISARSKRHHTLIHNTTILHTKTFFVPACHPRKKIPSETKLSLP